MTRPKTKKAKTKAKKSTAGKTSRGKQSFAEGGTMRIDKPIQLDLDLTRHLAVRLLDVLRSVPRRSRSDVEVSMNSPIRFVVTSDVRDLMISSLEQELAPVATAKGKAKR